MTNKWLLVQFGKDGQYWVHAFAWRKIAEQEGERDKKHGVLYIIVDLDELMSVKNKLDESKGETE